MELRPHQVKAVREIHNGCILCGDTGRGKTVTALAYYLENEAPRDIYVITTAKVRDSLDWESTALRLGITDDPKTTMASVITVDSWNNIDKYTEVEGAFFIFDEQRLVGSGAWVKAFYKIAKANHWIVLSATPGDTWLDYAPVFIANGFYRNITDFRTQHVEYVPRVKWPQVKAYHNVGKLVRHRNNILVEMPFELHTTRHEIKIPVEHDKELLKRVVKDRWHVYENRPLRDVSELFSVMRKVVYSDDSRLKAIRLLLKNHPKLIVFYNFDYELEILRTLGERQGEEKSDRTNLNPWDYELEILRTLSETSKHSQKEAGTIQTDWDYLLSPEGMRANESLVTASKTSSDGRFLTGSGSSSNGPTSTQEKDTNSSPTVADMSSELDAYVTIAEWNGHKHQPIPTTDRWVYLVQYQSGSEGWNCVETDAMCFYSPTYSYKNDHQAHGRIDRLNTSFSDLWYYRLLSTSTIDRAVMDSLRTKKSFNEAAFARKFGGFSKTTGPKP